MVACEFEYRRRFWMVTLVYVLAYAFYNLDHLNIVYAFWGIRASFKRTCLCDSCMPRRRCWRCAALSF